MKVKEVVKTAGGIAVGAGVGIIMSGAIGMVAPVAGMCLLAKGATLAGGYVLSSMIEERATQHFEEKVDDITSMFQKEPGDEVQS